MAGEWGGGCNSSSQDKPSSAYQDMPGEPLDCGTQARGEWAVAQGFALLAAMYSAGRGCSLGTLGLSQGEHLSCNFPGER